MLNNVRDFGAVGDGVTDDRAAIQAAIDNAVQFTPQGGILFPAGTYRVSRVNVPGGRGWSLDLSGVQDFMVMGEGPKSVVKLVNTTAQTGEWHVFILRNNCQRVVFKDLVIDGNRTGLTNPNEQSHGIEVEDGTEDLVVDRCILRECFGDGMRLVRMDLGGGHVKRLRIENSLFQTNNRSGLVIQRALEQIIIANCIFDATVSDQSIDVEPSDLCSDGPTDIIIHGCVINHTNGTPAVHLSGISGPKPLVNCKFTDNIVLGGPIFCTDVGRLAIQNNIVMVTNLGAGERIPVQVQRGGDSVVITGNLLVNDDTATHAVISLDAVNQRQVTRALVANNLCFARSGDGIQCWSSDDVAIQSNMIVATDSCVQGVFIRSETSDMDGISVRDNDVTVRCPGTWTSGIRIAATAPHQVGQVSVVANSIHGATSGIIFEDPGFPPETSGFAQTPVCALNRIADDVTSPLVGIENLPAACVVVGGATSRGGTTASSGAGRFIAGLGDPDTKVAGNVGDIFQRLDGTPGKTLYVKETGNSTNTGWKAK
jgi:Pectate lyase superfamily protein